MSYPKQETEIEQLDDLLEQERDALLAGNLEEMVGLLARKEQLLEALNTTQQRDLPQLMRLDRKVKRNQLLLNGALEGIRSVTQRMAALQKVRQSLETYTSDGEKKRIEMQTNHSVEKRA